MWTQWRPIVIGSKYPGAKLRELRAERGVGRPPSVLEARRA